MNEKPEYVYKLLTQQQWQTVQANSLTAEYASDLDLRDGYIHLSTASQVQPVATKYFADTPSVVVLKVNFAKIAPMVKWEPNSKGELFPHVYGTIPQDAADKIHDGSLSGFDFKSLV